MMNLPVVRIIPIRNKSAKELDVMLEPEGDCITIQPGQICSIVPHPSESEQAIELVIDYRDNMISLYLDNLKDVYIDEKRVR